MRKEETGSSNEPGTRQGCPYISGRWYRLGNVELVQQEQYSIFQDNLQILLILRVDIVILLTIRYSECSNCYFSFSIVDLST